MGDMIKKWIHFSESGVEITLGDQVLAGLGKFKGSRSHCVGWVSWWVNGLPYRKMDSFFGIFSRNYPGRRCLGWSSLNFNFKVTLRGRGQFRVTRWLDQKIDLFFGIFGQNYSSRQSFAWSS